ncbi:hypothetical protein HG536_0A05080 [Torulaspora globosa]|uniref:Small-subunit processome Utp12 domain-containing protein n=1 Tax=Torulaspora globosa TaxID=48254 RepID=A0A7G3ZB07_9SACH|nr:uncharacterized protein HG536_0A05080 [Torulaspora globosa]QLL30693.1 hypothetical protein HG536_0A05080 [Torulaspora globosa]
MSALDLPVVASEYDCDGRYLCYVTVVLNKQRVSVQLAERGTAINENVLYLDDSNLKVCALKWGRLVSTDTVCVFLALNNGEIWIYSPLANEVVHKLSTGNGSQVNDVAVSKSGDTLWCVDAQDRIYQFGLDDLSLKRQFQVDSCSALNRICPLGDDSRKVLVASHSVFLVDVDTKTVVQTFPGHTTPVTHLVSLTEDYFVTGAANDRFLNVYDLDTGSTKSVLVLQSEVLEFSHSGEHSIAVTTEEGVEIFANPLVSNVANKKRRGNISKQCTKAINVNYNLNGNVSRLPVLNVSINGDIINLVWLQNATIPYFAHLKWQELPIQYTFDVAAATDGRSGKDDRSLHGKEVSAVTGYREGNVRITHGDNFKHVDDAIKQWEQEVSQRESEDVDNATESLADKLELATMHVSKKKSSNATTAGTVTIVLSQALQSSDHSLLETVLNNRDEKVIRDTIFRLRPALAVILLERLAERIARQTHRQGALNVWVKWCLIIHGGYLVTIPNLMSSLSSLHSTLKGRSALLPRLLALETRLDSVLNRLHPIHNIDDAVIRTSSLHDEANQQDEDDDDEADVEYNEELDDAGLIEDGEDDYEYDESDASEDDLPNGLAAGNHPEDLEASDNEEAGYSDVEM